MAGARARGLRVVGGGSPVHGDLVGEYLGTLGGRSPATVEAYRRILRQLAAWVAERPGGASGLRPELLTRILTELPVSFIPGNSGGKKRAGAVRASNRKEPRRRRVVGEKPW